MAKFTVTTPDGSTAAYEGHYKVADGGVLAVVPLEGNPVVYAPNAWLVLEVTDESVKPGDDLLRS
jgi:hypothetical protein